MTIPSEERPCKHFAPLIRASKNEDYQCVECGKIVRPSQTTSEEWSLEVQAMHIVYHIGNLLYEALPPEMAHQYFVVARQKTNDQAIDFVKDFLFQAEQRERERWFISWDVASGGKEWAVLVGHKRNDGVTEILAGLDKDSDDGGNFSLASPTESTKKPL